MTEQTPENDQARFEALLAQALGNEEKALEHQAAKDVRSRARQNAVGAKASFRRNRERPSKQPRRQPRREG